jgi:hypothetical protein
MLPVSLDLGCGVLVTKTRERGANSSSFKRGWADLDVLALGTVPSAVSTRRHFTIWALRLVVGPRCRRLGLARCHCVLTLYVSSFTLSFGPYLSSFGPYALSLGPHVVVLWALRAFVGPHALSFGHGVVVTVYESPLGTVGWRGDGEGAEVS